MSEEIIGCGIKAHSALGPGLLESVYEECLCHELASHESPLLTYLRLSGERLGLLLNFNVDHFRDGIRRKIL